MANVSMRWNNSAFASLAKSDVVYEAVDSATQKLCAAANARAKVAGWKTKAGAPYACDTRRFPGAAVGLVHPNTEDGVLDQNQNHTLVSVCH